MKYFVVCLSVLLAGCQSMPNQSTQSSVQAHKPQVSLTTTPYTEFMGDQQIQALVTYANNPLWKCTTCASGQTSAQVLAEVQEVIALHPNIVVIQTGAVDIAEGLETSRTEPTFGNIEDMLSAFEQAGIPAVACTLPSSSAYDPYYLDYGLDFEYQAGIIKNLFIFNSGTSDQLTAGIDYTQAGLADVYPEFYQEVESFQVGGEK